MLVCDKYIIVDESVVTAVTRSKNILQSLVIQGVLR